MRTLALSLVSHTNVGKTTLARTLLRRDVGTVYDQAHVTDVSEAWPLLETPDARLLLWDTPGFGDTARLLRRLRNEGNPLGWFLHTVWDKVTDRPLWCSQEAVRNIRQDADVVLYLVNAAEDPRDAAYVPLELELLGWLERPVLLLLNQTGPAGDTEELEAAWRAAVAGHPHVRDVLSLDAFTRCWVQEAALLEKVGPLLADADRPLLDGLVAAWNDRNLAAYEACAEALGAQLAETAADRVPLPSALASKAEKQAAMKELAERLERRTAALMDALLDAHGLEGQVASEVREHIDDFVLPAGSPLEGGRGALWGGLLGGAATGVGAELLAGGLGFGSGVVVGAALGALGGAGLAKGFEFVLGFGKEPAVRWNETFVRQLAHQGLLRYLAVAQFGRGRGDVHDDALREGGGAAWRALVDQALDDRGAALTRALEQGGDDAAPAAEWVREVLRDVLAARYPEARALLGRAGDALSVPEDAGD